MTRVDDPVRYYQVRHIGCSMFSATRVYKHAPDCPWPEADDLCEELRQQGAAVAFGLMGMAEAIGERETYCKKCGVWLLDCECPYVPTLQTSVSKDSGK